MEAKGIIFNIQQFSTYDGPGIRTTVFFKGCNLRCIWCHNPESYALKRQLMFYEEKCAGCGNCFRVCPVHAHSVTDEGKHFIDRNACTGCGICCDSCYAGALAIAGKEVTAAEIFRVVERDILYYKNSGGGVTFSGGECMLQPELLKDLLLVCRERSIHTAIDTAGNVPFEAFEKVIPLTDLFLYDVKAADDNVHKKLTGVSNQLILSNLKALSERKCEICVRIPYIPGCNEGEMEGIAEILSPLNIGKVEILPYHRLGESKRAALGMEKEEFFATPSNEELDKVCKIFAEKGLSATYSKIK